MSSNNTLNKDITLKWLGVGGIELKAGSRIMLIDPYFTRIPLSKLLFGKASTDKKIFNGIIKSCDHLMVTHPHFDHIMDVPDIIKETKCRVYGSPNTLKILSLTGVPSRLMYGVKPGDILDFDEFKIEIFESTHGITPGFTAGKLKTSLKPPIKPLEYRMDICHGYYIFIENIVLMTDPGRNNKNLKTRKVDILLINPCYNKIYFNFLIEQIHPEIIIPIHWDNFFKPLNEPLEPNIAIPNLRSPILRRIDLDLFKKNIKKIDNGIEVLIPEIFYPYNLKKLIEKASTRS